MSNEYSVWCYVATPNRRGRITTAQKTAYEGHTATGGRYALCPDCGQSGPRQVVFEGDALTFWCPKCEKEVTSCALPSSNAELRDFARGGCDFFNPKGWGLVELEKIEREGCKHPKDRWEKQQRAGLFLCTRCGHAWDMALPTRRARQANTHRVKRAASRLDTDSLDRMFTAYQAMLRPTGTGTGTPDRNSQTGGSPVKKHKVFESIGEVLEALRGKDE